MYRYSAVQGDTVTYEENDYGSNVAVTIDAQFDGADGCNSPSAYILYGPAGSQTRQRVDAEVQNGKVVYIDDRALISAEISADSAYEFTLYCTDLASTAAAFAVVGKGHANVHFAGSGYGVGVGCFVADATQDSPRFEVDYPSRFNKSAHVAGVASFGDAANFNDEANFYASASFGGMSFFHQPTYFFDDIQVSGKATFNGGTEGVCSMISDGEEIAFGAVPSQSTQTYECAAIETYGLYLFIANVSFATNTAGRRMVELYRNTTTWLAGQTAAPNTSYTRMTATAVAMFGVGDVPRVCMYQNSGSELKAYVRVWLVRLG